MSDSLITLCEAYSWPRVIKLLREGRMVRQFCFEVHFWPRYDGNRPRCPLPGVKGERPPGCTAYHNAASPRHPREPEDVDAFSQHASNMIRHLRDLGFRLWKHSANIGSLSVVVPGTNSTLHTKSAHDINLIWAGSQQPLRS